MSQRSMKIAGVSMIVAGALCAVAASAETTTYTYDARGRLVQVVRTGAPQGTETVRYTYDKAGNRTRVTSTSTSP